MRKDFVLLPIVDPMLPCAAASNKLIATGRGVSAVTVESVEIWKMLAP